MLFVIQPISIAFIFPYPVFRFHGIRVAIVSFSIHPFEITTLLLLSVHSRLSYCSLSNLDMEVIDLDEEQESIVLGASDQHKSDSGQQYNAADSAAIPTTSCKATAHAALLQEVLYKWRFVSVVR